MSSGSKDGIMASGGNDEMAGKGVKEMLSGSEEGVASSGTIDMASSSEDRTPLRIAAIRRRQKERRRKWQSKCRMQLDFSRECFDKLQSGLWNLDKSPEEVKILIPELFKSLVRESLVGDFIAWAPEDSATFVYVVKDLLNPSSIDVYSGQLKDVADRLPKASLERVIPKVDGDYHLFWSVAEGMLDASYKKDIRFLEYVLQFCGNHSNSEAALRLWQSLRSVKDMRGYNPLHIAVIMGFHEAVEVLVLSECRGDVFFKKQDHGETWEGTEQQSITSSIMEQVAMIQVQLQEEALEQKHTVLRRRNKHEREHESLGQGQADSAFYSFDILHARTREGWTPLHLATVATGYDDLPDQPRGAGESEVAKSDLKTRAGEGNDKPRKPKSLVRAPCHSILETVMSMYDKVLKPTRESWDFMDNFWLTPLHYAVLGNRREAVEMLLESSFYHKHVNAGDYHQKTPLHMAVCHSRLSFFRKSFQLSRSRRAKAESLIEFYAHPSIDFKLIENLAKCPTVNIHAVDCCLYTPLHWAVHNGNTEAVARLLSLGDGQRIRATLEDIEGRTVMQLATEAANVRQNSKGSDEQIWESQQDEDMEGNHGDKRMADHGVFEDIRRLLLARDDVKDDLERLYSDRQVYVDATNAILVGSALIASVTFQGWLQPPISDIDLAQTRQWVRVFWWSNSLSFFFAIASGKAGGTAVLPQDHRVYIGRAVKRLHHWLSLTCFLLMMSANNVLIAFVAAGFAAATMTNVSKLEKSMTMTTSIGLTVCFIIIVLAFNRLQRLLLDRLSMAVLARVRQLKNSIIDLYIHTREQWTRTSDWCRRPLKSQWIPRKLARQTSINKHQRQELDQILKSGEFLSRVSLAGESHRHQLHGLTYVYEEVKRTMNERARRTADMANHSCGVGLTARGIHHWMDGCPIEICRDNSMEADLRRWVILAGRVDTLRNHIHFFQDMSFKLKEFSTMCITYLQLKAWIEMGKVEFSHLESDWYRFCHVCLRHTDRLKRDEFVKALETLVKLGYLNDPLEREQAIRVLMSSVHVEQLKHTVVHSHKNTGFHSSFDTGTHSSSKTGFHSSFNYVG